MTEQSMNPRRTRRWRQFSLRTFFVVVTVVCVWFGWQVHRAKEQWEVVEWVESQGGQAYYDYQINEKDVIQHDAVPPGPAWLSVSCGRDLFWEVKMVFMTGTTVDDVRPLAKLTSLEYLFLGQTQISDVAPLEHLTMLRTLSLTGTHVADVSPLANLTRLEHLYLNDTPISDVTSLAELPILQELTLYDTQLSDVTPLLNLTTLDILQFGNTKIREEHFMEIKKALPTCDVSISPHADHQCP